MVSHSHLSFLQKFIIFGSKITIVFEKRNDTKKRKIKTLRKLYNKLEASNLVMAIEGMDHA